MRWSSRRQRLARIGELIAATGLALLISRAFWWPGSYIVSFDTVTYTGPNYVVTMDAWRQGSLPLWNDFLFGGVAHLANPQTAALSPMKVIGLFFEPNRAMGITVAVQMVLMAIGGVLLLRRLGVQPPFALIGSVVMVVNGAVLMRSIQFEQIAVVAWIPWVLLGITAVLSTEYRSWLAIAGLAAATAMILVAGHPQMLYLAVVLAGLWTLGVLLTTRSWTQPLTRIGDLAGAVVLGALAAGLHLVAFAAGVLDSAGSGSRPLEALRSPLLSSRIQDLPRAVLGSISVDDPVLFAGSFEGLATIGVASSITALTGVVMIWRTRRLRPLAMVLTAAMITGIFWALGPRTGVFTLAYRVLPGFDLTRASSRWLTMTAIVASIALALGLQVLRHGPASILTYRPSPHRTDMPPASRRTDQFAQEAEVQTPADTGALRFVISVTIVGFVVIVVAGSFGVLRLPDSMTLLSWLIIAIAATVLLMTLGRSGAQWTTFVLAGLIMLEILLLARGSVVERTSTASPFDTLAPGPAAQLAGEAGLSVAFTDDAGGDFAYLRANYRPNTNVFDAVYSLDGYDGGVQITQRYFELLERLDSPSPRDLPLRNQLPVPLEPDFAAELGLRWVVLANDRPAGEIIPGWSRTPLVDDDITVWENPAWLADAMIRRGGSDTIPIEMDQPGPGRITLSIPDGFRSTGDDVLVVMRQFAPGWTAELNGETVPVTAVEDFWLGIDLVALQQVAGPSTQGETQPVVVEFQYRPAWIAPGVALSLIGIVGIGISSLIGLRSRHRVMHPRSGTPGSRPALASATQWRRPGHSNQLS